MDINKIFIELRYNEALMFNDMSSLQKISNALTEVLPDIQYDANNKVLIMINQRKHYTVNIMSNRMLVDFDEPKSFEEFKELAEKVLCVSLNELNINNLTRIGVRSLRGEKRSSHKDALTAVKKNFFKTKDDEMKILSDELIDIGVNFSFTKDKYKINLHIKPNNFSVLEMENNIVKRNENKYQILIDSDIYRDDNLEKDYLFKTFFNDFININTKCIDAFLKKIGNY